MLMIKVDKRLNVYEVDLTTGEITNVWSDVEWVDDGRRFITIATKNGTWTKCKDGKRYETIFSEVN